MIDLHKLSIRQGNFQLDDLDLSVPAGSYAVLMGRSGSGKTTIMEVICGLRKPQSGRIVLNGVDVTELRPGERNIGYVPQDGALFPTMKVRDQIGFPLRLRKAPQELIRSRVGELANLLNIAHLLDRMPQGLSGGESQRVALGRALAMNPAILCMDEPLSSLDDESRQEMVELLKSIRSELKMTCLHITHHQFEASELADVRFSLSKTGLECG